MRFTNLLTAAAVMTAATSGVEASVIVDKGLNLKLGASLSLNNHYGAPHAPWESGHKPGWYYGHNGGLLGEIPSLTSGLICVVLELLPLCLHCPHPPHYPPPKDDYEQVFHDLKGATQAADYITYGLVNTVDDCQVMCDSVDGCTFFNTYHDNNAQNGKDGSDKLTCSLFKKCHDKTDATNVGGQPQPDGTKNFITESAGYCKK